MLSYSMIRRTAVVLFTVAVLAGGCANPPVGDGVTFGSDTPQTGEPVAKQPPVAVGGVDSCSVLTRMQTGTEPVSDGLSSLELDCLTPGPAVRLAMLRGKPVLVNLWASWCGPCRTEMPILQAAHERYGSRVQFVGVDTRDGSDVAAAFLREVGVTYPQLSDPDARLLGEMRSPGLPVTVVLGANGQVLDRHIGAFDEDSLSKLLERVASE